jgi:hypothetical protein
LASDARERETEVTMIAIHWKVLLVSAAGTFTALAANPASAYWKRSFAASCTVLPSSPYMYNNGNAGVTTKRPPGSNCLQAGLATCAYADDASLPHETVTSLTLHGWDRIGITFFNACTKWWDGTGWDCSATKDTRSFSGAYAVTFSAAELSASWRNGFTADFPYVLVSMNTCGALDLPQYWGWFASN